MKKKVSLLTVILSFAAISSASAFNGDEGKYYVSGLIGYGNEGMKQSISNVSGQTVRVGKAGAGLILMAAMGYNLSNNFRTDISIVATQGSTDPGFTSKSKIVLSSGSSILVKGIDTQYGGFLNGYYDLFTDSKIMPYIMGGFGLLKSDFKTKVYGAVNDNNRKGRTKMGYQFGAGIDVHLGVGWTMDVTYRFINHAGKKKYSYPLRDIDNASIAQVHPGTLNVGLIGLRRTF
jgi:opacity protein-like surface antigen